MNTDSKYLREFFLYLEQLNIAYCVVGQSSQLPEVVGGDVDIIVNKKTFRNFTHIIQKFSLKNKAVLVQALKHEQTACCYVLVFKNLDESIGLLNIDVCSDFLISGELLVEADALISGRIRAKSVSNEDKEFYIAKPVMEFLYYLIKKIKKGQISGKELQHLKSNYCDCPNECNILLNEYWSDNEVNLIIKGVESDNNQVLQSNMSLLSKSFLNKNSVVISYKIGEFKRKLSRYFQPTGFMIVLLGPDGVGKTAVGDGLKVGCMPMFRQLSSFHLRPSIFSKANNKVYNVTEPHNEKPRGALSSILKVFYFLFDYVVGYLKVVRPKKVRSSLIVFDRYYHDLLVDPVRYRYGGPMWLAKLVGKFIPQPDLFIILDAPMEVIQKRKQEVPAEETQRQRLAYLAFAENQKNCIVLDTSLPLTETVQKGTSAIVEFLALRQLERK